jgi:hypothetical protein
MAAPKSHSLNELLTSKGSQLKSLTTEAQRLLRLRDTVRNQLPRALAPHCIGAQLEAGTLVLYMDNAATATPIRYQHRELLKKLAIENLRCTALRVQVLPEPALQPPHKAATRTLSDAVRQILETTAAELSEGSLRHSLQRLARNRNPRL